MSTWLLAIARHKALSALRRQSTDELDDDAVELIEEPGDNPEVAMQRPNWAPFCCAVSSSCRRSIEKIIDLVHSHERSIDDVAENASGAGFMEAAIHVILDIW